MLQLIAPSLWVEPTLQIKDQNDVLRFHIQDVFNYHGYDAVGGAVLGFRLLQKALSIFQPSPGELIERRGISLVTAFPGLGARDCFELVTRMVTENRIEVNPEMPCPDVVQGVKGSFYFEFHYQNQTARLSTLPGAPSPDFIQLGKASKKPDVSQPEQMAWRDAKYTLANALLASPCEQVIRVLAAS